MGFVSGDIENTITQQKERKQKGDIMFVNKEFKPFEKKVWLATPTQHIEMLEYIQKAYDDNW